MVSQSRVTFILHVEVFEYDSEELFLKKSENDSSTVDNNGDMVIKVDEVKIEEANRDKGEIVSISKGLNLIETNVEIELTEESRVEIELTEEARVEDVIDEVKDLKDFVVQAVKGEIIVEVKNYKDLNLKEDEVKDLKDLNLKEDEVKDLKDLNLKEDEVKDSKDFVVKEDEEGIVEDEKSRSKSLLCQTENSNCSMELKLPVEKSYDYNESKKFFEAKCNSANRKSPYKKIWKYNELLMSWEKQ